MSKLQRPKGTQDIFGEDIRRWQRMETIFREQMDRAGYLEIRTPVFEYTDLFRRGVGEATDIVNKEMYTFEQGGRELTLRPEGTAGTMRAYIEQGMSRWPKPVKLYYMGPMFRYERPQAGRQRQFHQMGLELVGLDTPEADAEAILLAMKFFESLGLPNLKLEVNNIGTPEERQQFRETFRTGARPFLEKLCEDCNTRYDANPMRMLDCKVDACREIYAGDEMKAIVEADFTGTESQAHFNRVTGILDQCGIPWTRNFKLVRGLDYYTNTVFEITSTHLGAQNAVCGGGRYDKLVELLGGPPTPAVGWALGMERLVSLLDKERPPELCYYIVTDQHAEAFRLADKIRGFGFSCEVDLSGKSFGKQLQQADRLGARQAVIIGEAEAVSGVAQLKDLRSGKQGPVDLAAFEPQSNIPPGLERVSE